MTHFATKTEALIAGAGSATALSAAVYPDGLSAREGEVLRLVAAGKSNPEIAEALVISIYTVYRHVNHILAKTGCSNRVEATSYAHRHKLVE
jgi:DNA-binding CsgD family transcriptional regulator